MYVPICKCAFLIECLLKIQAYAYTSMYYASMYTSCYFLFNQYHWHSSNQPRFNSEVYLVPSSIYNSIFRIYNKGEEDRKGFQLRRRSTKSRLKSHWSFCVPGVSRDRSVSLITCGCEVAAPARIPSRAKRGRVAREHAHMCSSIRACAYTSHAFLKNSIN